MTNYNIRSLILNRTALLIGIGLWWLLVAVLSLTSINFLQTQNILGFSFLLLAPGTLTVMSLRLGNIAPWGKLALAVVFSLLEIILTGLLVNTLLPSLGFIRPLDLPGLIFGISILVSLLLTTAWFRLPTWTLDIKEKWEYLFPSKFDVLLAFLPVIFVVQSIIGAISLNNGGSNFITLAMLGEMGIFFVLILSFSSGKKTSSAIPTAIFFVSLALLLMTSLRGWYITGHDIQLEYHVFELAKNSGIWQMSIFRDPYNACLSITILPTILFNFMEISDPYIYKILFQVLFAFCPVYTYLIARFWFGQKTALLSGLYFTSFPIFFYDMPFFARQEIALVFYGAMLFVIFNEKININLRRIIFVVLGFGAVLSHYSTSYTILFVLGLLLVINPAFKKMHDVSLRNRNLKMNNPQPNNELCNNESDKTNNKINIWMIILLCSFSFLWTSTITSTGGNLSRVIKETVEAVGDGFIENNRSVDVLTLFSFKKVSQQAALEDYIDRVVEPARSGSPGEFYDESSYGKYSFRTSPDEYLPLTETGLFFQKLGVDAPKIISLIGQVLAKIMQILVPIGFLALAGVVIIKKIDREFYAICFCCLTFIALNVLLPVLSTSYGIHRAMQQSMFALAPLIVVGCITIGILLSRIIQPLISFVKKDTQPNNTYSNSGGFLPSLLFVFYFLYVTTFVSYIFGGNVPVLFLSNSGKYYDNYYIRTTDVYGMYWLSNVFKKDDSAGGQTFDFQTDNYSRKKIITLTSLTASGDIFPGLIKRKSYVFLGAAVVKRNNAWTSYNGDPLPYIYPIDFLESNKDLLYNGGSARVYR